MLNKHYITVQTTAATGGGTADNLGNHIATQNIQLNGHWLAGDADNEGLYVNDLGNVGIGTKSPNHTLHVKGWLQLEGSDFYMSEPARGDGGRALVHWGSGNKSDDQMILNLGGDFEEGVKIDGSKCIVNGNLGVGTSSPASRLHVATNQPMAGYFTSNNAGGTHVIHAEYEGIGSKSEAAIAVYGVSKPIDKKGYGGWFEGSNLGIAAFVNPTGSGNYYGMTTVCNGGSGFNTGLLADASGSGQNVGVVGNAYGTSDLTSCLGVLGNASGSKSIAVYGNGSSGSIGVYGTSNNNYGVYGHSIDFRGVCGESKNNIGIYGYSENNVSGFFVGDVMVTGTLTKGGGSFKIDHPLDPDLKYLYHSFVESPDMKNVYDGVVVLDNNGEGCVQLPDWFEALNKDFRYQLTCIGGYAPVYIAEEITHNQFKIAGGKPALKVSWQVTGIRQDAWANTHRIPVEEEKQGKEIGKYLHPQENGVSEILGIDYEERKKMADDHKRIEDTQKRIAEQNHKMQEEITNK